MTDQSRRQHVPEGGDLARIALRHAREAARQGGLQSGRRTRRPRPAAGRSRPVPLSIMVGELITAMGWGRPETAAVLSRWRELVGSATADHLKAVGFDPDTGTLTLASESPAWAAQARLISKQLTSRVNSALGSPMVRAVHILRPAPLEPIAARPPADRSNRPNRSFKQRCTGRTPLCPENGSTCSPPAWRPRRAPSRPTSSVPAL